MGFFESLKAFLLIYFISIGFVYALQRKLSSPIIVPGDLYIRKPTRSLYIPFGSSIVITVIIFLIFRKLASI
jgi:hypothetical protein